MKYFYDTELNDYWVELEPPSEKWLAENPRSASVIEVSQRPHGEAYTYENGSWVQDASLANEIESANARMQRNSKLLEMDLLVCNPLRWADLTDAKRAEWAQYRTDLLNVPQQEGFPSNISWPLKPD